MNYERPNPRLQRTPLRAPLSRKPLGDRMICEPWVVVLALFVACSGNARVGQFHPQNDVTVNVMIMSPAPTPQPAEVFLRDANGTVLFRAITNRSGFLQLPLDYRAIQWGDSIEARVDMGPGGYIGSTVSLRPGVRTYRLPVAEVREFFPEPGVVVK